MKRKQSKKIFMMLAFMSGLALFIYPTLSDYVARRNVVDGANKYKNQITQLDDDVIKRMWEEAREYNASLNGNPVPDPFIPGSGRVLPENYLSVLDIGDGIMAYVDIPKIKVYLPIYHGASEEVLTKGAGHIEQTALPIGGEGNLSVLTAHTGFAAAEMFNRLIEIKNDDIFMIHILDEVLTYKVEDIRVILPEEIESLFPVEGKDYVTLVTCTPYGVNSHRLLVRGIRIPNPTEAIRATEKVPFPWRLLMMLGVALFVIITILIWDFRKERIQKGS